MFKKILALFGSSLLVFELLFVMGIQIRNQGESKANKTNGNVVTAQAMEPLDNDDDSIAKCQAKSVKTKIKFQGKTLHKNQLINTQSNNILEVSTNNDIRIGINFPEVDHKKCQIEFAINAPSFQVTQFNQNRRIIVGKNRNNSTSFILKPKTTGKKDINLILDYRNSMKDRKLDILVSSTLGFPPVIIKLTTIIGTVIGFILNIPWLWDCYQSLKQKENKYLEIKTPQLKNGKRDRAEMDRQH